LTTADGLPLPAGTKVCLDTTNCQVLDEETPSGTVLTFPGLPLREHPITITAPGFPDATGTITIEADQTVTTSIQLSQLSGTVEITLVTSDGNPIPASTTLCLADRCDTVDNLVAADSASGSIAIFNDVLRGTYPITVTNATPYLDASGEIAVPAATTAATTITLLLPDVTVTPTMGATATTEATAEATSTESTGEVFPKTPTVKPTASATASIGITNPVTPATGSGTVSTLPSTGAGSSNTAWLWPMCALAASFLLLAATTRRRHRG
jgi:hypothetical protein